MSTFARTSFNTKNYAASRPVYPRTLYETVLRYHKTGALPFSREQKFTQQGGTDLALDLGCGTGQATAALTDFRRVIGVDPSAGMIEGARKHASSVNSTQTKFEFVQSAAEELNFLKDASVDLVAGAQSGHWFDWQKMWPEIGRVLRTGGTAAFWCYSEMRLPQYPSLTPRITDYAQGSDVQHSLGPHWQRPGRTILERHLLDIPEPRDVLKAQGITASSFGPLERIYFAGLGNYYPDVLPKESTLDVILRTETTWGGYLGYLNTFSSLHTYLDKYPEDAAQSFDKGGEGNIAERFWKSLMKGAELESGKKQKEEDPVTLEWPLALIMVHKL
ncbi:S-adenosyl-L-methionine-dependent methyltransferase [Mycena floridula]|nr:S-adenosyl-L-methionine-dependent methyltransferase [Mycena floridula]